MSNEFDKVEPLEDTPERRWQIVLALDQLANAILGGWCDETLSSRCWRMRNKSKVWNLAYRSVNGVFFWQKNHCQAAFVSEQIRRNLPPELRIESKE